MYMRYPPVYRNYAAPHLDAGRHFCYTNLVSGRNPEHGAFPKRSQEGALEITPCGKFRATKLNMQMYSRGRKREHSKCFRTGDCRVGSTPTICAKSSTLRGAAFLFLRQTMQGMQGGIRTARARRFVSRRAATVLRTVARARENPTVCAKYHYSILHWVVIFYCRFAKFRCFSYRHLPFIFK